MPFDGIGVDDAIGVYDVAHHGFDGIRGKPDDAAAGENTAVIGDQRLDRIALRVDWGLPHADLVCTALGLYECGVVSLAGVSVSQALEILGFQLRKMHIYISIHVYYAGREGERKEMKRRERGREREREREP